MARIDGKHVIAVWGAPNGGKSTVAVNMATILADSGYMTCLVSAADHGELQAFFQAAIPRNKGLYAAISNGRNVREALTEARPNLCLLELDTGGDTYEVANISTDQVNRILQELRDQFTYVIIDCTNYKDAIFTGLGLVEASKVVVCIPHRVSAATWHIANQQMLEAIGSKTVYVDANIHEGGTDMEQLLESIDLPECPVKLNRVRSAFYCENTGNIIVLQGGREEKRYKKNIMALIQILISIEDEDTTNAKKKKKEKAEKKTSKETSRPDKKERTKSGKKKARDVDEDEVEDDSGEEDESPRRRYQPEREPREIEGRQRKMSARQMRKAEKDAVRAAQRDIQERFDEEDEDRYDY